MLDINLLRTNPDLVRENIKKKFQDAKLPLVDEVIELDKKNREAIQRADYLRSQRNSISKQIGMLMGKGRKDEAEAAKTAEMIGNLLSMAVKPGNSSIFVGKKEFEIMKQPGRGTHGHIAILTNSVDRAIYHLGLRGVKFDMDSKKVGKDGKATAIYMADEIAGFAIHLVQR